MSLPISQQKPYHNKLMRFFQIFLIIFLISEASLSVSYFYKNVWLFFIPTYFSDLFVDLTIMSHTTSFYEYLTAFHNEHRIITTKAISIIDFVTFNQRYVLHRSASIASLFIVGLWLSGVFRKEFFCEKIRSIINACLVTIFLFAPTMVAVVAFPYFLQHFLGTLFAVGVITGINASSRAETRAGMAVGFISSSIFGLFCLASNSNAELLIFASVISLVTVKGFKDPTRYVPALAILIILTVVWRLAFLSPASHDLFTKIADLHSWLSVADYAWRIFSLPAYFAGWHGMALHLFAAANLSLTLMACLLPIWIRRKLSYYQAGLWSIVVGHVLTITLIALGRSGGEWAAEDPKYFYYAAIVMASSAVLLLSASSRTRTTAYVMSVYAAFGAVCLEGENQSINASKPFYRGIDEKESAASLNMDVGEQGNSIYQGRNTELIRLAREAKLNMYGAVPAGLLGSEFNERANSNTCVGGVDETVRLTAEDGEGLRVRGWVVQPSSAMQADIGIIAVNEHGIVVGDGIFVAPRPDVIQYVDKYRLLSKISDGQSQISDQALISFSLYMRPSSEGKISLITVGLVPNRYSPCDFAEVSVADLGISNLKKNAEFLADYALHPPTSWSERLSSVLAWTQENR